MNEQTEWWQMLTRLSPFLIPIASAMVALLIRDLLDPRQWQRLVRKTLASIGSGILVFAGMFSGYLALFWYVGNEDSPIISIAWIVVGLGIFPATLFASIFAFRSVEPNPDWYINSRFVHFFHNGSWPTLSVDVRPECLPANVTFINGRIFALRERIGEYHLRVTIGYGSGNKVAIDETTKNPRQGWVRVMQTVLKAQLGDLRGNVRWQERIPFYGNLRKWSRRLTPTPLPNRLFQWQNHAYLQIHSLARRVDAK